MASDETVIERHQRVVRQPSSHMDLSEHVTWLLAETVDEIDYPMQVTVTIEAQEVQQETPEKHADHETAEVDGLQICKDCKVVIEHA